MKRKNERVPGFDEVIFRDRNKEYGAYDLRHRYPGTLGLSLLFGLALAVILVVLPSLTMPTKAAEEKQTTIVISTPDPDLIKALQIKPEKPKPPEDNMDMKKLIAPVVADPGENITNGLQSADDYIDNIKNEPVTEIVPDDTGDGGYIIPPEPQKPRIFVPEMPEFPGGDAALLKFIADNIIYPEEAVANNVQGRITIRFVVSATGAVDDVTVMASQGTALDLSILEKEAVRVIRALPLFKPGKQDGVPVPVYYTVPVTFTIK